MGAHGTDQIRQPRRGLRRPVVRSRAARIEAWTARCSRSAARAKDASRSSARAAGSSTRSSSTRATCSAGRTRRTRETDSDGRARRHLRRCRAEYSTAAARSNCFPGTRIAAAYGADEATEEYRCSYGVNPDFRASLVAGPLREAAARRYRRPARRRARRSSVLRRDAVPARAGRAARPAGAAGDGVPARRASPNEDRPAKAESATAGPASDSITLLRAPCPSPAAS